MSYRSSSPSKSINRGQLTRSQLDMCGGPEDSGALNARGTSAYDVVALEARNRTNERLVANLNSQLDRLQQTNRDLERRLDEAVAVESAARHRAANIDLKKAELEIELKGVDRHARRLQLDKETVVEVADKELTEAKFEIEKSRKELDSLDLEVAQLRAEKQRLEDDNSTLSSSLNAQDADMQRFSELVDRVQADKGRLSARVSKLLATEKELVLEIDRLKQKKGPARRAKSPNRFDAFIRSVESERDYWKQEVQTLQEIMRHKGPGLVRGRSRSRHLPNRSRSSSGQRSPVTSDTSAGKPVGLAPPAMTAAAKSALEEERDYYKREYELQKSLRQSSGSHASPTRTPSKVTVAGTPSELRRVMRERDELQAVLDKFERHMSEVQTNVKVLTGERDRLSVQCDEARTELQRTRHELLRSPKSSSVKTSLAAQAVLRRVEGERDVAFTELRRAIVERDTLRERLRVATETLIGDRARFEQRVEDLQLQLDQVLAERSELDSRAGALQDRVEQLEDDIVLQMRRCDDALDESSQHKASASRLRVVADETERSLREHQQRLQDKGDELHSSEEHCRALDDRIDDLQKALQSSKDEGMLLRANLSVSDREKCALQAALDEEARRHSATSEELSTRSREIDELRDSLHEQERRLERTQEAAAARERESKVLRRQLEEAAASLRSAAEAHDATAREGRRTRDDLVEAEREIEELRCELRECCEERERLADQARDYVGEVKHVEQLLSTKEEERSHLLAQYRAITMEAERQGSHYTRLESESSSMRRDLLTKEAEVRRLHEQNELLEAEVQEHLSAQQALEDQVSSLHRTVAGLEERQRILDADRHEQQRDLKATRGLCAELEVVRDQQQRSIGTQSAELEQAQRAVEVHRQEAAALRGQLSSERQAAKGTEALIAANRDKEFKAQLSRQEKESEAQLLRDRLTLNESKIDSLSREIVQLRARNSELESETERLRRQLGNEKFEKERAVQEALRYGSNKVLSVTGRPSVDLASERSMPAFRRTLSGSTGASPNKYNTSSGYEPDTLSPVIRPPVGGAASSTRSASSSSSTTNSEDGRERQNDGAKQKTNLSSGSGDGAGSSGEAASRQRRDGHQSASAAATSTAKAVASSGSTAAAPSTGGTSS